MEFKPRRGRQAILHLLKQLADLSGSLPSSYQQLAASNLQESFEEGRAFVLARALDRLYSHTRPGSLIFLISDFRGLNAAVESTLVRLSRHCDVIPVLVYDSLECELPRQGRYRLSDGYRKITLNSSDRQQVEAYQERFRTRSSRLHSLASKYGMRYLSCRTTDQPIQVLQRLLAPQLSPLC